jgi:hypothetical protein
MPLEQALALGGLLRALHPSLGALRGPQLGGTTVPDGYGALERRGPYERLLLSEWALADAAPDEFLRRAGSGEHLFYGLQRRTQKQQTAVAAVFDTGADQLGAPRLAQVALWMLLARRAEAAGARFLWGTLAEPGVLHADDDLEALRRLLQARSFARGTAVAWAAWRAPLAAGGAGERWRIGAPAEAADSAGFSHRVGLQRRLDGSLEVLVTTPSGRRSLRPALPPPVAASRLLAGDFNLKVQAPPTEDSGRGTLDLDQAPVIASDNRRVLVAAQDGSLLVYRIGPGEKPQRAQRRSGGALVAAMLNNKHVSGLIADRDYLYFWRLDKFRTQPRPPANQCSLPHAPGPWLPAQVFMQGGKAQQLYLIDRERRLLRWRSGAAAHGADAGNVGTWPDTIDTGVLCMREADTHLLAYVRWQDGRAELALHSRSTDQPGQAFSNRLLPQAPTHGFLCGRMIEGRWFGAWAVQTAQLGNDTAWDVSELNLRERGKSEHASLRLGAGWEPVGLCLVPGTWGYGLAALSPDRLRLCVHLPDGRHPPDVLYASDVPIASASLGGDGQTVALLTERRELVLIANGSRHAQRIAFGDGEALQPDAGQPDAGQPDAGQPDTERPA